jgi:hypothetical protein
MPADKRTGPPGPACSHPGLPSSVAQSRDAIGPVLVILSLIGCGGRSEPPGQGHPSPLTVLSPDLAAGVGRVHL